LLIGFLFQLPSLLIPQISSPAYTQIEQNQKAEADRLLSKGVQQAQDGQYVELLSPTYQALAELLKKQGRVSEAQQVLNLLKVK
jgi:predicted negative regulator of RcsB-dependent stress response